MKNFRKVLALVLVVATLFSFVAMASAKTLDDYSDAADVQYKEAVDVLSAIGILKGYDGKFHANDPIDRDEIAKMIAVLRNAGVDNSALFTGANTFADVKGTWAEGYIAYAAQVGIVAGRNATTFDPDAKVTGTEVLKMLLCVLGYDAKLQGYVGANWQVNVMRDAIKMNLTAGLKDFDPYAPATRDEAAQMMFNALLANMVIGYVSENIVIMTNSLYDTLPDYIATPDTNKAGYEVAYCNAVLSNVPLYKIFAGLSVVADADCYGRPGHTWIYTPANYSRFFVDAYAKRQTEGGLDATLLASTVYVDGFVTPAADVVAGNGVVVEYYDAVTVVINTYIGKIGVVNDYYNYFTLVDVNGTTYAKFALNGADVKAGQMVLYWLCNGACGGQANQLGDERHLHAIEEVKANPVAVAEGVNYKDWNASYIVANGNSIKYASLVGNDYNRHNFARLTWNEIEAFGENWDLYLDEFGFIKYLEPTTVATEYTYTYIVEGTLDVHAHGYTMDANGNRIPNITRTADMVNYGTDGVLTATEDVVVGADTETALHDNGKTTAIGVLAKVYDNGGVTTIDSIGQFAFSGTELNKGSHVLLENKVYATSETVFMIRTKNLDGSYTYEQVTGYQNLKGNYVARTIGGHYTNIQYFVNAEHPAFASYVFIDAVYTRDLATTFLVLGEANFYKFKTEFKNLYAKDYVCYDVLVEGEPAVVLMDIDWVKELPIIPTNMYNATMSYIGVADTIDGKELPIYCFIEQVMPDLVNRTVDCVYTVVDGETYIRIDETVFKMAEGGKILTLTANWVDGELVPDIYEGLLNLENGGKIIECYITFNDAGEITTLIALDVMYCTSVGVEVTPAE